MEKAWEEAQDEPTEPLYLARARWDRAMRRFKEHRDAGTMADLFEAYAIYSKELAKMMPEDEES